MNRHSLNRVQREAVLQFMQFTRTDENVALYCLARTNFHVERAVDLFFQQPELFTRPGGGGHKAQKRSANAANDLFYPEDDVGPERIGPHGMLALLNDLRLDATDRKTLILAWLLKAATQCEFSKEEWISGLTSLGVFDINELRTKLDSLDSELERDRSRFKEMYRFAFGYGKPERQRNMDLETAILYWEMLFRNKYALLEPLIRFLRNKPEKYIVRDVWNLVLEFLEKMNPDLSNFDEDGAWPVVIDEFVASMRENMSAA